MIVHAQRGILLALFLLAGGALSAQVPLLDDAWLSGETDRSLLGQLQALSADSLLPGVEGLPPETALKISREARLRRIQQLSAETSRAQQVVDHLQPWLDSGEYSPLVDSTARWVLSSALSATGDGDGARKQWQNQGILGRWRLVGPFDNERGSGIDLHYPAEEDLGDDSVFPAKRQDVSWRDAPAPGNGGQMELSWWVTPATGACAYLSTWLSSPQEVAAALRVSSSGAYRIWLDGKEVGQSDGERTFTFDQDVFPVLLPAGSHHLLVKSGVEQGRWAIRIRATTPAGGPIAGLTNSPDRPEQAAIGDGITAPPQLPRQPRSTRFTQQCRQQKCCREQAPRLANGCDSSPRRISASRESPPRIRPRGGLRRCQELDSAWKELANRRQPRRGAGAEPLANLPRNGPRPGPRSSPGTHRSRPLSSGSIREHRTLPRTAPSSPRSSRGVDRRRHADAPGRGDRPGFCFRSTLA
ncbi:MAG TPA: hypothetical protein EYN79_08510 [Planctomycetes bacterium]|nr:hypothetical protein [Planctomycetota bacterium]